MFAAFRKLVKIIHNKKGLSIAPIQSDHGEKFKILCNENDILYTFSTPQTPQQNMIMEKKNRSLEKLTRTMFNKTNLSKYFWTDDKL